ncbi:MAG: transposase [Sedimenticola sp.]
MPNYRRVWMPGGTYFFTVNLSRREKSDLLVRNIGSLREVVSKVRRRYPFKIHGWVVLPDHLHCVITLPGKDTDYSLRWRLIKGGFSRQVVQDEWLSDSQKRRGERGIWQRRYWEHLIRDERDFQAHMDYVHINPVKHGLAERVVDWPYSTFHRLAARGVYSNDWAGSEIADTLDYDG